MHLRNAPTRLMKDLGYGAGYRYAHDEAGGFAAGERYLPEGLPAPRFYEPVARGLELRIGERLAELRALDAAGRSRRAPERQPPRERGTPRPWRARRRLQSAPAMQAAASSAAARTAELLACGSAEPRIAATAPETPSMDTFIQQIINGLVLGSMYALVALGYTMVYGIINLINFAHGEVLMVGALTSWTVVTRAGRHRACRAGCCC